MSQLFAPLKLRSVTLRNRLGVSPMCMYSSTDGHPGNWHLVHLPARAIGGAAVIIQEATAVSPEGRISPHDAGLWSDEHVEPWSRVTRLVRQFGAVPAVQLAHAGCKAGTARPWEGGRKLSADEGGWQAIGPTHTPFRPDDPPVRAMTHDDIARVTRCFADAARRALDAGYEIVEIHAAHGYLLHSFYSPITNRRNDRYGGSFEGRVTFLLEVVRAVRSVWPERLPLFVRLSCSDWVEGGWALDDSVTLSRRLKPEGVDLVDCSSGGASPHASVKVGPGYQVPFARTIRRDVGITTAAVGLITEPRQAEGIIVDGSADLVLLGRESLRDPHFPLRAAKELSAPPPIPLQYARAV